MVAVYGDISTADDFTHELGPEKNFNESMYFNFFDRSRKSGGFVRLGNRANEGYAEMTIALYLPDGSVLFQYKRPEITSNDAFDAGGMRFEAIDPLEKLRTTYDGSAVHLTEPTQMADPREAFRNNPMKKISVDLIHEAAGPAYGSLESSLIGIKYKLTNVILPLLSVIGLVCAAMSLYTGNPNAKTHILYAILGCIIAPLGLLIPLGAGAYSVMLGRKAGGAGQEMSQDAVDGGMAGAIHAGRPPTRDGGADRRVFTPGEKGPARRRISRQVGSIKVESLDIQ